MYQEDNKPVVEEEVKEPQVEEEAKVAPQEEAPVPKEDAPKVEKKPLKDPDECHELTKSDDIEDIANQIESRRKSLLETFNKSKMISRISMFVVVAAVVAAIVLIFNEAMALKITGYSIAGAVLLAMLVYYILTKDKFPKASRDYIASVTDLINSYDFTDSRFNELKVYPNKKKAKTDFDVDRVYKNSTDIGSRNVITGKYDGHIFEVSENALYTVGGEKRNQRKVLFLGKYISLENEKRFENRYIFNLKGNPEKLVDQPNDTEDLKLVLEEDNLQVFAPNDKPIKDVFGTKFFAKLKEIKVDEKLLNFVMVVWAGHTSIYLSYDDSVTVLPFEHPFDKEAQEKYKSDLVAALELATLKK